jgi:3-mercaptopyruvate sulfurtransferase SseA
MAFAFWGLAGLLALSAATRVSAREGSRVQVDPQTGRAIGAREMDPEALKRLFDSKGKVLIIDVRDTESFEKETIKGAIHIPLEQLKTRLKEIPKDTTLVFT